MDVLYKTNVRGRCLGWKYISVLHLYLCILYICIYTFSNYLYIYTAAAELLQSCLTLCDPLDCSPSGSSVHRIFQARILEWLASRGSSQPRDQTHVSYVSCIGRKVLYHWRHLGSPYIYVYVHTHTHVMMNCIKYSWQAPIYMCMYTHTHTHTHTEKEGRLLGLTSSLRAAKTAGWSIKTVLTDSETCPNNKESPGHILKIARTPKLR